VHSTRPNTCRCQRCRVWSEILQNREQAHTCLQTVILCVRMQLYNMFHFTLSDAFSLLMRWRYFYISFRRRGLTGIAEFAGLRVAGLDNDGLENFGLVPAAPATAVPQPRCCKVCLLAPIEGFQLIGAVRPSKILWKKMKKYVVKLCTSCRGHGCDLPTVQSCHPHGDACFLVEHFLIRLQWTD